MKSFQFTSQSPAQTRRTLLGCAAVLAIALIGYLLLTAVADPTPDLPASCRLDGWNLIVSNTGPRPWTNASVTLNSQYRCSLSKLEPRSSATMPLAEFVSPSGARFSLLTTAVMTVEITAQTYVTSRLTALDELRTCTASLRSTR